MITPADLNRSFPAAAEYLTTIWLIKRDYGFVANSHLAQWLEVSTSAVSQQLSRLKKLELVKQPRYGHIELTLQGQELAKTFLRRHYILEHLFVEMLDYPWDKADEEAHILQAHISENFADHLYERLGRPETCPHGNPLPGSSVERTLLSAPRLDEAVVGQLLTILRITEEGEHNPVLLSTCFREGLRPGVDCLAEGRDDDQLTLAGVPGARSTIAGRVVLEIAMAHKICFEKAPAATLN